MAPKLYGKLEAVCEKHVQTCIASLVGTSQDATVFLGSVERVWNSHCDQMALIRNIFLYLDRTYVLQTTTVASLWDMGVALFRKHLSLQSEEVESRMIADILSLVQAERNGDSVNRSLLKNLLRMQVLCLF